jgi:soluble P-type ATPase
VRDCISAGITPVMITGDHPATARAIAHRLGIVDCADALVLTGADLATLDDAALRERVEQVRVYARVDPAQKIRIVEALQAQGHFVAMTGDGVNDAPALKRADIGVAMGKGGTDVAREASSLVLLDDNFATIVAAVKEGRRIYDNIRKFVRYAMTGNSGEIWTIFLAPLLLLPIPLLPIHILWVNLVTDGLPGLALAAEPAERGIMRRPPRPPTRACSPSGMWQHILGMGLLIAGLCLAVQAWCKNVRWRASLSIDNISERDCPPCTSKPWPSTPATRPTPPPSPPPCRCTRRWPTLRQRPARCRPVRPEGARQHLHPHHEPDHRRAGKARRGAGRRHRPRWPWPRAWRPSRRPSRPLPRPATTSFRPARCTAAPTTCLPTPSRSRASRCALPTRATRPALLR